MITRTADFDRHALISAFNKEPELLDMATTLQANNFTTIWASTGTVTFLEEGGVGENVRDVAELVGGKPILDHKVVTLSREVSAGLLVDVTNPTELGQLNGAPVIDFVFVDPYDMATQIRAGESEEKVRHFTDVGALTLLHAAAKGRRIVLGRYNQWAETKDWMERGCPDKVVWRRIFAARAERQVADYALMSAYYLDKISEEVDPIDLDRSTQRVLEQHAIACT